MSDDKLKIAAGRPFQAGSDKHVMVSLKPKIKIKIQTCIPIKKSYKRNNVRVKIIPQPYLWRL